MNPTTATPDPNSLYQFLVVIGFLMSLALNASTLWKIGRVQKREVSFAEEFQTRKDCELMHAPIGQRFERIEAQQARFDTEFRLIRDEMKRDHLAFLKADEERAIALHNRLNEMPDKIIVTLRNTGVIKP